MSHKKCDKPLEKINDHLLSDATVGSGDHEDPAGAVDIQVLGLELLAGRLIATLGVLAKALEEPDGVPVEGHFFQVGPKNFG